MKKTLSIVAVAFLATILAADCFSVPHSASVVCKSSFLSQTGSLASTVVYAASSDQDIRISISLEEYLVSYGPQLTVSWTGLDGYTKSETIREVNGTTPLAVALPIHIAAGSSVSVSVSADPSSVYNMVVTTERL